MASFMGPHVDIISSGAFTQGELFPYRHFFSSM